MQLATTIILKLQGGDGELGKLLSGCNRISRDNRNDKRFRCQKCGYETHADRAGAMNIEHRTRDYRYILESQGGIVRYSQPAKRDTTFCVVASPTLQGRGS